MARRIILVGGYGHRDIGDESMLTMDLINFRKLLPDAEFVALSDDPAYTIRYHKVVSEYSINHYLFESRSLDALLMRCLAIINLPMKLVNLVSQLLHSDLRIKHSQLPGRINVFLRGGWLLFNARRLARGAKPILLNEDGKRLLKILESGDILFNVGGGNLNSVFLLSGLYGKCFTYLVCKTLGKTIVLSGQTIGPIDGWLDRKLAGYSLNRVDAITLRDVRASRKFLEEIGVTKPLIKDVTDDAFLLPSATSEEAKNVLVNEDIEVRHPLVGMNILNWQRINEEINPILAQIADYLIVEKNARIIFVPMQYKPGADDREAAAEVRALMKHKDRAKIIMTECDDRILKGIIGMMDLAIGVRYHFVVYSATMQVPTVSICLSQYQLQKNSGIMGMMGQGSYVCEPDSQSFEQLRRLVDEVWSNRDNIRRELMERVRAHEATSRFTVEYAAHLLDASTAVYSGGEA